MAKLEEVLARGREQAYQQENWGYLYCLDCNFVNPQQDGFLKCCLPEDQQQTDQCLIVKNHPKC